MQLVPTLIVATVMGCFALPAQAQLCTLALSTGGTLGLNSTGTVLGSDEGLGSAGALTIVSIGSNTISISAPARVSGPPSGYDPGGESVEVAYSGLGGLAAVTQRYTSSASSFVVGTIGLSTLAIHNRIFNANGFAAGTYVTRTVVTCS